MARSSRSKRVVSNRERPKSARGQRRPTKRSAGKRPARRGAPAIRTAPSSFTASERFLKDFKPGSDLRPMKKVATESHQRHLHPTILSFWKEMGFGPLYHGYLQLLPPAKLQPLLDTWLGDVDPTRIAFGATAFGDLIYWHLLKPLPARGSTPPEFWDTAGEIRFLSVNQLHTPWTICRTPQELFDGELTRFLENTPEAYLDAFWDLRGAQQTAFLFGAAVPRAELGSCYGFCDLPCQGGSLHYRNLEAQPLEHYVLDNLKRLKRAPGSDEEPLYEIFPKPLHGRDLEFWEEAIGSDSLVLARSMFGDLFVYDPRTHKGIAIRPIDGIVTTFGKYDSPQVFLDEILEHQDVRRVILRPGDLCKLARHKGALKPNHVWYPVPYPSLGGDKNDLESYQQGEWRVFLELIAQMG